MRPDAAGNGYSWYRKRGKRIADAFAATMMLALFSPVMLVTAACVLAALGSPVLFRQERAGRKGLPFTLIKFRSMLLETGPRGENRTPEERLTRFGRFLRRTSLDEIPELWNVVRGDMSLVGPRPLLLRYNDRYSSKQARRLEVRPGITGWAQVHGRNDTSWSERLDRDVWYVEHLSPWVDLRILFKTIPAVLVGRGVTPEGESFMPEFIGGGSEGISDKTMSS